jgi:hypothetical protein
MTDNCIHHWLLVPAALPEYIGACWGTCKLCGAERLHKGESWSHLDEGEFSPYITSEEAKVRGRRGGRALGRKANKGLPCLECEEPAYARSLCEKHFQRHRRQFGTGKPCGVGGCERFELSRGLCPKHYQRWRRGTLAAFRGRRRPKAPPRRQPEREFQDDILAFAEEAGWELIYHTRDSRKVIESGKGFPDLVLVKAPRLIFAEVKAKNGWVKPEQRRWLDELESAGKPEVYVWKPRQMGEIREVLG